MIAYLKNFVKKFKPISHLWVVFGLEFIVILLAVLAIVPREAVLFLTGIMAFYILFAPFREATLFFVLSIPFFAALPITENFDTMANWRILLLILFLRSLFTTCFRLRPSNNIKQILIFQPKAGPPWADNFKRIILNEKIYLYVFSFFMIAFLSLINAESVGYGLRKILFLANTAMLFVVITHQIVDDAYARKIQLYSIYALLISLIIGYIQLLIVFFTPLYNFWQWWASRFIAIFYGQDLTNLLSYSNTWFSYYDKAPPTLRIFSVFPDSHSFALFSLIGMIPVTYFWFLNRKNAGIMILVGLFALLSIILSGSRGFWASAIFLAVFAAGYTIYSAANPVRKVLLKVVALKHCLYNFLFCKVTTTLRWWLSNGVKNQNAINYAAHNRKPFLAIILIFFLLFPVGSLILSGSRMGNIYNGGRGYELLAFTRARSIIDIQETSNKGRLDIWKSTLTSFKKHPLLGVGIGNFPMVIGEKLQASRRGASAHNLYFDIAAEMGIAGLIVFLFILWEIFKKAWRFFCHYGHPYGIIFIFYLIWILSYSLFDVVLLNDKVLLFFITQIAILYAISDLTPKTQNTL